MTVTYTEYRKDKDIFFRKHKNDFNCDTSPMDKYGRYSKTYSFADGAQWEELISPEYVTENAEIKKASCKINIKMLRTEYWNTEAPSKYYYEQFNLSDTM